MYHVHCNMYPIHCALDTNYCTLKTAHFILDTNQHKHKYTLQNLGGKSLQKYGMKYVFIHYKYFTVLSDYLVIADL